MGQERDDFADRDVPSPRRSFIPIVLLILAAAFIVLMIGTHYFIQHALGAS